MKRRTAEFPEEIRFYTLLRITDLVSSSKGSLHPASVLFVVGRLDGYVFATYEFTFLYIRVFKCKLTCSLLVIILGASLAFWTNMSLPTDNMSVSLKKTIAVVNSVQTCEVDCNVCHSAVPAFAGHFCVERGGTS